MFITHFIKICECSCKIKTDLSHLELELSQEDVELESVPLNNPLQ